MAFTRDTVTRILEDADIVDIIGEYVSLKKAGSNFKGLCPFHKEKTPSFVVSPEKQIFHCFGCHETGDAIGFVMKMDHVTFPEAVRMLAERLGIKIEENAALEKRTAAKMTLFDINKRVADFYHRYLMQAKESVFARTYLKKRGITTDTTKKFLLGYAPVAIDTLVHLAAKHRLDLNMLEQIGLVRRRETRQYRDWFRDRIMFPITDGRGRVIAFGGRVLGDALPKYLNSPETVLFKKSSTLYGLHLALPHIRQEESIIVLEGYMDVIALHQTGIRNTVATLGTALTADHVASLRRFAKEVIVIFDADTAGVQASIRTIELFINSGLRLRIASLPEGFDPDTFIKEHGPKALKQVIGKSKDGFRYLADVIGKREDILSLRGKEVLCKTLFPIALQIDNRIERNYVVRIIAEKLGEKEEDVLYELKKVAKPSRIRQTTKKEKKDEINAIALGTKQERALLEFLLARPEKIKDAQKNIDIAWISSTQIARMVEWLFEHENVCVSHNLATIMRMMTQDISDDKIVDFLAKCCFDAYSNVVPKDFVEMSVRVLEKQYLESQMKVLHQEIAVNKHISPEKIRDYEILAKKIKRSR